MSEALYIFTYDIKRNRIRNRVARRLKDKCMRVQRSVFEARLTTKEAHQLAKRCERELEKGDSLLVYRIPESAIDTCMAFGAAIKPASGQYILI